MRPARRPILALLLLLFFAAPARTSPAPGMAAAPASAAPEAAATPGAFDSPRRTMAVFMEATETKKGLSAAADCLDLSVIPAGLRTRNGRELAAKLRAIIDRIDRVNLADIPDTPDAVSWVFYRDPRREGIIALAPDESGAWRFTAATVASIPALYNLFEDRALAPGVLPPSRVQSPAMWLRAQVPHSFRVPLLGIELWQWIGILLTFVGGTLLSRLLAQLTRPSIRRLLARHDFIAPPRIIRRWVASWGAVLMSLLWWFGLEVLSLPPKIQLVALFIVKVAVAVAVIRTSFRFIEIFALIVQRRSKKLPVRVDNIVVPFFEKAAKVGVVFVGFVFTAEVLGVSATSLVAGLGFGGLVLALAAQDTVKNLFGTVTVILDRPFEIGDDVKIGGDILGTVEGVGFRSTRVRTYEGTLMTVPNGNLIAANINNLGRRVPWLFAYRLRLDPATPRAKVKDLCDALRNLGQLHLRHDRGQATALIEDRHEDAWLLSFTCQGHLPTGRDTQLMREALLHEMHATIERLGLNLLSAHPAPAPDTPSSPP